MPVQAPILIKDFGKYQVVMDTATGLPICNCKAGKNGLICKHVKEIDPSAQNVWEERKTK